MYKKILVPMDGSELAECVLAHVRAVATGCYVPEVVLLMVIEPIHHEIYGVISEDWVRKSQETAQANAEEYLLKLADKLKQEGVSAQTVIMSGRPADEILDYAKKNQVDLIIMSTHGRSGVSHWFFGSVAEKVLRHSVVPMLVVSPPGCRIG